MYKRLLFVDEAPHPFFNPEVTVYEDGDLKWELPNDLCEPQPIDPVSKHELLLFPSPFGDINDGPLPVPKGPSDP